LWFYGGPGTGKTAVGQTLAEILQKEGRLAASHFFCRTAALRNNANSLMATIAYQVALSFPSTRTHILNAIEADPAIFERSLRTQLQKIIIEPLESISPTSSTEGALPKLVIIDGLDECHDQEMQCYIIKVILESLPKVSSYIRFFIASRPEQHIRMSFSREVSSTRIFSLDLASDIHSYDDIRLFLEEEFKGIKAFHPLKSYIPASWPSSHIIETLVVKSSGQFIYASIVVNYIKSTRRRPTDRLDIILGLATCPPSESPFAELDALYNHIVSSAEDVDILLRVLGVLLIPKRWYDVQGLGYNSTTALMEKLLFMKPGDIHITLLDLSSLVTIDESSQIVQITHASFVDFLLDPSRSRDFSVDLSIVHTNLARGFIHCVTSETSSTKSRFGQDFYFSPLLAHCSAAAPTKELYEDILRIDLFSVYEEFKLRYSRSNGRIRLEKDFPHLWHWVPSFFQCLNHSKAFRDVPIVFKRHSHLFDSYLKNQIAKYYVDDRLVDLLTIITLFPGIPPTNEQLPYSKRASTFLLPDDIQHPLWMIDNAGLNIGILLFECGQRGLDNMPREKRRYLEMLSRFLLDEERSSRFHVNGDKYAWAALRFLEHLNQPSFGATSDEGFSSTHASSATLIRHVPECLQYAKLLLSKAAPLDVLAAFLTEGTFKLCLSKSQTTSLPLSALTEAIESYLKVRYFCIATHFMLSISEKFFLRWAIPVRRINNFNTVQVHRVCHVMRSKHHWMYWPFPSAQMFPLCWIIQFLGRNQRHKH